MTTYICHNPACQATVAHRDAFLCSVSLEQVAFCSQGCVDIFNQLDQARRTPVPEQRRPVTGRVR